MARGKPGDPSFPRRSPRLKRGASRPGVPFIPQDETEETPDFGRVALFGIFRDGRRVYLPPKDRPGVTQEEAERIADQVGGEVIELWNPEDAA